MYSCRVIEAVDQFRLLSQRTPDGGRPRCPSTNFASTSGASMYREVEAKINSSDACDYVVYTREPQPSIEDSISLNTFSIDGIMEMAVRKPESDADEGGISESMLLEVVLWQSPIVFDALCSSNDLGTTVQGMSREYDPSKLYRWMKKKTVRLDAIGFQCNSSLITGTATINGLSGTYGSFVPTAAEPIAPPAIAPGGAYHHGFAVPRIFRSETPAALEVREFGWPLLQIYIDQSISSLVEQSPEAPDPVPEIASNDTWLTNLFKSVDAHSPVLLACYNDSDRSDNSVVQPTLLNSTQFQQAFIRALKAYTIEITTSRGPQWYGDLVYTQPTVIVVRGQLNPIVIVVLLVIWAASCSTLGALYSTRPRWSDMLDGFSMFRFGSDVRGFADGICCVEDYEHCSDLLNIPGLVGDSEPKLHPGHISLVRDTVARRDKRYQGSGRLGSPAGLGEKNKLD